MPTRRSADSGNSCKGYFSIEIISNILLAKNTITTRQKMQPGEIKAHLSLFLLLHFGSPSQLSSGESFGNPGVAESPAHHPNLQRLTSIHTLPYPQMHLWTTGREGGRKSEYLQRNPPGQRDTRKHLAPRGREPGGEARAQLLLFARANTENFSQFKLVAVQLSCYTLGLWAGCRREIALPFRGNGPRSNMQRKELV